MQETWVQSLDWKDPTCGGYNLVVSLPLTPSTLFPTYDTQSLCASKMSLCKKFTHSLIQLLLGN